MPVVRLRHIGCTVYLSMHRSRPSTSLGNEPEALATAMSLGFPGEMVDQSLTLPARDVTSAGDGDHVES